MDAAEEERFARYADPETGKPDLGTLVNAVMADAKSYFEAQKELTTLEVSEKVGRAAAVMMLAIVLILIISAAFLMGSVALSLWLGSVWGSVTKGFLTVAGIYILLGLLFYWLWRGSLKDRITLAVIRGMHGND